MRVTRSLFLTLLAVAGAGVCSGTAHASGDIGCSRIYRPVHHGYEGCSNMALLSPGNDTRVNLMLLMAELRPATLHPGMEAKVAGDPLFTWEELADLPDPWARYQSGNDAGQEPTPCPATLPRGDAFATAVRADSSLQPQERASLLEARTHIQQDCPAAEMAGAVVGAEKAAQSPAGRAYAGYLAGAAQFWQSRDDEAIAAFQTLGSAASPWVRETAAYMVARAGVRRLQVGAFDEYGGFTKDWHADLGRVNAAEAALNSYLRQYPHGLYTKSARGLVRRVYWIAGDSRRLAEEYGRLLRQSPEQRGISDAGLLQEIDNKLPGLPDSSDPAGSGVRGTSFGPVQDPLLLAMLDLQAMRTSEPTKTETGTAGVATRADISLATLQQQRQYFTAATSLFEYLLAAHAFYVERRPAEVLRLIPDAARQGPLTPLQFSRQMLRGMALEALKDRNTLAFLTSLLPGATGQFQNPALQLALAWHAERAGTVAAVFASGSPVRHPYLRGILLARIADAALLRAQATTPGVPQAERDLALFTLLWKEATRGQAAAFLADLALVPPNAPSETSQQSPGSNLSLATDRSVTLLPGIFVRNRTASDFACPRLRDTEAQLAQDATNPTAALCVAEFVRLNQPGGWPPDSTYPDELGDTAPLFPGAEFARMDAYLAVLKSAKAGRNEKAYALFRAVSCYAPAGSSECGGKDVSKAQRRAWFQTLKRDYADTRWAGALKYYW